MNWPAVAEQGVAYVVWRWKDAPEDLRTLAAGAREEWHTGEPAWVVLIPVGEDAGIAALWLYGETFGDHLGDPVALPDGRHIRVGYYYFGGGA